MALGAWLPLFQMGLEAGEADAEALTTFPPNALPLTGFYDSSIPEVAKNNAQALVLGATGLPLTADLTVTEGHKHETEAGLLGWRQLGSLLFEARAAYTIGSAPDECYDALLIDQSAETKLGIARLWLTLLDAAEVAPRVRLTHAAAVGSLILTVRYYSLAGTLLLSTSETLDTSTARTREWVDLAGVDLSGSTVDATFSGRIPLIVKVYGSKLGSVSVALHEIAWGGAPV